MMDGWMGGWMDGWMKALSSALCSQQSRAPIPPPRKRHNSAMDKGKQV